jgi:hypothetical protein
VQEIPAIAERGLPQKPRQALENSTQEIKMKNLTRCFLLLSLTLLLLGGFMFMREPAGRKFPVSEAEARPSVQPAKSPSFSESEPDAPSVAVTAATISNPSPANDYVVRQPRRPGDPVLDIPGAEGEAAVPAVFAIPNTDPNLNSEQLDKVNEIVRDFTHEVSAGSTNPDDPAYLARWQKAQAEADDRLKLVLGQEDYLRYMLAAGTMDTSK